MANLQAKGGGNACGRNLEIVGQNRGPPLPQAHPEPFPPRFSQEIPETLQNRRKFPPRFSQVLPGKLVIFCDFVGVPEYVDMYPAPFKNQF